MYAERQHSLAYQRSYRAVWIAWPGGSRSIDEGVLIEMSRIWLILQGWQAWLRPHH